MLNWEFIEQSNSHLLVSGPSQTCVGFTALRIFQLYLVVFVLCMRSRRGLAMDHMYVRRKLAIGILSLCIFTLFGDYMSHKCPMSVLMATRGHCWAVQVHGDSAASWSVLRSRLLYELYFRIGRFWGFFSFCFFLSMKIQIGKCLLKSWEQEKKTLSSHKTERKETPIMLIWKDTPDVWGTVSAKPGTFTCYQKC